MSSAIMTVPAAYRDAANAFAVSMGWGPDNYSVPLSPTGAEPATHWTLCATVGQGFIDLLASPPPEALPILSVVNIDISAEMGGMDHFAAVMGVLGLQRIEASEL